MTASERAQREVAEESDARAAVRALRQALIYLRSHPAAARAGLTSKLTAAIVELYQEERP